MTLHVMEIERFALHDGPGIRTTVFLQGCPLRCPWCANPESQHIARQLMYLQKRCVGCGSCAAACPHGCIRMQEGVPQFDRACCVGCGRCAAACPTHALRLSGKAMTPRDVLAVLKRDASYYRHTGGGITISGGEPFVQAEGLRELLTLCKAEGLHTAVETTGNVPTAALLACEPLIDLFLFDLKHTDAQVFAQVTRGDLALVLHNLSLLPPDKVVLRVPVIPGFNRDAETLRSIFALAVRAGIRRVDLLPYHTLGVGKYAQLGLIYPYPERTPLRREDLAPDRALGASMGLTVH